MSHDRAVESIRLDKDFADVPGLYPPGKVVHFYRCPHSNLQVRCLSLLLILNSFSNEEQRGEWSTPLHFREIVISGTMFQDHLFTLYEKVFSFYFCLFRLNETEENIRHLRSSLVPRYALPSASPGR